MWQFFHFTSALGRSENELKKKKKIILQEAISFFPFVLPIHRIGQYIRVWQNEGKGCASDFSFGSTFHLMYLSWYLLAAACTVQDHIIDTAYFLIAANLSMTRIPPHKKDIHFTERKEKKVLDDDEGHFQELVLHYYYYNIWDYVGFFFVFFLSSIRHGEQSQLWGGGYPYDAIDWLSLLEGYMYSWGKKAVNGFNFTVDLIYGFNSPNSRVWQWVIQWWSWRRRRRRWRRCWWWWWWCCCWWQ